MDTPITEQKTDNMDAELRANILVEALPYIQEYYGEHLSLADLAKAANIGERECLRCFGKVFHREMGCTPQEYRKQKSI